MPRHSGSPCRRRRRALAGQHYIVRPHRPRRLHGVPFFRLASAPDGSRQIELTVERLPDGEVSTLFHRGRGAGDEPRPAWACRAVVRFWRGDTPALLIGGGSAWSRSCSTLRLARRRAAPALLRLLVSARSPADLGMTWTSPGAETTREFLTPLPARMATTTWPPHPGGRRLRRRRRHGVCFAAPPPTLPPISSPRPGAAPAGLRVECFGLQRERGGGKRPAAARALLVVVRWGDLGSALVVAAARPDAYGERERQRVDEAHHRDELRKRAQGGFEAQVMVDRLR